MEGFNGWARPLDGHLRRHGYRLYNANNRWFLNFLTCRGKLKSPTLG